MPSSITTTLLAAAAILLSISDLASLIVLGVAVAFELLLSVVDS
jgi:hypothetical protein